MARRIKISAGKLNIRLHPHSPEVYASFLKSIHDLRVIGQVHGDRYGMISLLDRSKIKDGFISGVITTFIKLDVDGDWYDIERMKEATEEQISEVNIPEYLSPNSASFYFEFDLSKHHLTFQNYSRGKWITPYSAQKLFSNISRDLKIMALYGEAKISIVQTTEGLERLFSLKKISEIKITLLRPNPDIFSDDFEQQIEGHLDETHSRSMTITYQAEAGGSIVATDELREVSGVALENGKVEVIGRDQSGAVRESTERFPTIMQGTFDPDQASERNAFFALIRGILPGAS